VETNAEIKEAWIEATVIRADGTEEPLGVISHSEYDVAKEQEEEQGE